MSSFIKKSMLVGIVFSIGSSGLFAQDQMSGKTIAKPDTHMTMTGNIQSHDTVAIPASQSTTADATPVEKVKLAPQTTCPVMGGKIEKAVHADYKGKRVYFCCNMCLSTFNKDPETYIKKLEKMGQGIETIATVPNGKTATKDTAAMKMDKSIPMKGMDHSKM